MKVQELQFRPFRDGYLDAEGMPKAAFGISWVRDASFSHPYGILTGQGCPRR